MRNVMLILTIGILFLGCVGNKVEPADRATIGHQAEKNGETATKYPAGCQLLADGYLVCPKSR